jgi:hypothetical protein
VLWKGGDGFVIDGLGPDGVSARVLDVDAQRDPAADRLPLSLRLRDADRIAAFITVVHVHGGGH